MRKALSEEKLTIIKAKESGLIRLGDTIHIPYYNISGVIGEIQDNCFFIFQNTLNGSRGNIDPESMGFKYSYVVYFEDNSDCIITEKTPNLKIPDKIRYFVIDKNWKITGVAKDKRQLITVLKHQKEEYKIFDVKEVKTKVRLEEVI